MVIFSATWFSEISSSKRWPAKYYPEAAMVIISRSQVLASRFEKVDKIVLITRFTINRVNIAKSLKYTAVYGHECTSIKTNCYCYN